LLEHEDGTPANPPVPAFAQVPKCVVPKVVGRTLKKARARIVKVHCKVRKVRKKFSTLKKKAACSRNARNPARG
jgi:hypothetical protein